MARDDTAVDPSPLDNEFPPLDAVDSRWWYWIAAYLFTSLLFIPAAVIAVFLFLSPVIVAGPAAGPRIGAPLAIVFLLVGLLVLAFGILAFIIFLMLPVALYMDARRVRRADLDWEPEPVLYAGVGLLQFVVTPVVGFLVAVYYLYQRHSHVGVP